MRCSEGDLAVYWEALHTSVGLTVEMRDMQEQTDMEYICQVSKISLAACCILVPLSLVSIAAVSFHSSLSPVHCSVLRHQ